VKIYFGDNTTYFNTVTLQIDDEKDIMGYWKTLHKAIKYYYPHILIFWVKEYTKRGKAHLHFLTDRALDGAWLSRTWHKITGSSFVVKAGNTASEIRNPAAYMLKYMTKAHGSLDLYKKGERIYGFLGARSPKKKLLGFEAEPVEFYLDQHYNINSNYWMTWYNEKQLLYGSSFIEYMNYITLPLFKKLTYIEIMEHDI
jgi:hypothetical protein